MHQNNKFVSCRSYFFKPKQVKHTFGKINELLIVSIFKDHILLIFMQKMGPGKQVRIIEVQLYLTPLCTFHNFA